MCDSQAFTFNDVVTAVSVVTAVGLGGFSIWQHRVAERLRRSRDCLDGAVRQLEGAFRDFDLRRSASWGGLPEPDRLLWLSVARMLREADSTAAKITEQSHVLLYKQARTYWRGKFFDLLQPLNKVRLTYFSETLDKALVQFGGDRAPISPKSLKVLRDFTTWPSDEPDPLERVESFSDQEINKMRAFGWRSVGDYLEALDAMCGDSEARKEHWRAQWDKPRE